MNDPVAHWFRRIQDADGYYGLDKPDSVGFEAHGGQPRNFVDPGRAPFATTYINCYIERTDEKACNDGGYLVDPGTVSQHDKLMVDMVRTCQDDWEFATGAFFQTIPGLSTGNAALKEIAKELLEQAKARGLSNAKAEAIRREYDLPALTSIGA